MFLCCNWKYYFPLHHVFPNFYAVFFVPHNESGCWPVDWSKKVCIYVYMCMYFMSWTVWKRAARSVISKKKTMNKTQHSPIWKKHLGKQIMYAIRVQADIITYTFPQGSAFWPRWWTSLSENDGAEILLVQRSCLVLMAVWVCVDRVE